MKVFIGMAVVTSQLCVAHVMAAELVKPAIKTESNKPAAPVPGKTSFTAGEAKSRMEKAGYDVNTDPVKDNDGIWFAEANNKAGRIMRVMVDYQGNVFESAKTKAPMPGATKLKSEEARTLMEKRGYLISSIPIKDDQGIWYAEGTLSGKFPVQVMVDHEGSVFESAEYSGHPNSAPDTPLSPHNPIQQAPPASQSR